jgi:hypothetical protein
MLEGQFPHRRRFGIGSLLLLVLLGLPFAVAGCAPSSPWNGRAASYRPLPPGPLPTQTAKPPVSLAATKGQSAAGAAQASPSDVVIRGQAPSRSGINNYAAGSNDHLRQPMPASGPEESALRRPLRPPPAAR